jgi:thymidylate synthase (FAD)
MQVKLISITEPLLPELVEVKATAEDLIVYTARVSNPDNQLNLETAPRLLNYLIKNHHWSPFEMVDMTVEIKTSRAIAAQILRHRSFSFQEFSQRYSAVTEFENVELRRAGSTNRQSSTEEFDPINILGHPGSDAYASEEINFFLIHAQRLYGSLLRAGVAKEVARMILPLTTQTTLYMKGSIRSWIHYLQIRTDEHTQKEHRLIAEEIQKIFNSHFPNIAEALKNEK